MTAHNTPSDRPDADGPEGALRVAQGYFEAWNRRDPDAIVATFAQGGTYNDPAAGRDLSGPAIAAYATSLFTAFPDLSFDVINASPSGPGQVVGEWCMRGTNSGPLAGGPPTGRTVVLPGVDLIAVEGDRIRSVRGFFDQKSFLEQLGLRVIAQPDVIGPFSFGTSLHVGTGRRTRPGAVSLTSLQVRSDAEVEEVRARSREILAEMLRMPGFIAFFGGVVGRTLYTVTAWEDPESPRQLLREGAHRAAMQRFFGADFAVGGATTVWAPHHLNTLWARCAACNQMVDAAAAESVCQCGAELPEPPPYW